jgi:hypothetical protein
MATIARFPPERAFIRSYLSRMAPSLVINFHEASTKIARSPFLPAVVIRPIQIFFAIVLSCFLKDKRQNFSF